MEFKFWTRTVLFALMGLAFFTANSYAKSAAEIDASVDTALAVFKTEVFGAEKMLAEAKGVLVLSPVIKGGIGIGAEYGTGALRIDGVTTDYFNTISGSIGFQLGGQVKKVFLLFMQDKTLQEFRHSDNWQAGVDGSVALIVVGADGSIDTTKTNQPILAFVLGQKGLMYNLTLEGTKFNKITPDGSLL